MASYSIQRLCKMDGLIKNLVDKEINFSRSVHFSAEINLTRIEEIRKRYPQGLRPTYTAFVAKAIALALVEYPYANRRIFTFLGFPFFQSFEKVDIAIAIERNIPPFHAVAYMEVLRDVNALSLDQATKKLNEYSKTDLETSEQWKSFYFLGMKLPNFLGGWITCLPLTFPSLWAKYRGGACMISSPAKYGVDGITAAWPHALGASFGLAQKKPMVVNDKVEAVQAFTFVLNWDRRVMAGAQAAKFFARICEHLRNPVEISDSLNHN